MNLFFIALVIAFGYYLLAHPELLHALLRLLGPPVTCSTSGGPVCR